MAMDVSVRAPHGGIFVLFAVGNILGYLIALAAGVIVGAACVIALKSHGRERRRPRNSSEHHVHANARIVHHRRRTMPTKSVVVGSAVGLHARPAAIISEAAGELDSEVLIGIPGDERSTPARR